MNRGGTRLERINIVGGGAKDRGGHGTCRGWDLYGGSCGWSRWSCSCRCAAFDVND